MTHKVLIKSLIFFLIAAFLIPCFTACSGVSETESEKDIYLDDVPGTFDYGGETVKIAYWDNEFVTNELIADNESNEVIDRSIAERNSSVEERLGVKLEFVKGANAPEYFMPQVEKEILAGTFDCDIISGVQCQTGDLCINGCYLDLTGAKYLDISKPYWAEEYINELRIGNDRLYMLGGDISLTTTAWSAAMLFDTNMYDEIFGDLDGFYNSILDGEWTLDVFFEKCRGAYSDLNENGIRDVEDRFGLGFRKTSSIVDMFCFSSGVRYSVRDQNNFPVLDVSNEKSNAFCEKFCYQLNNNEGIWSHNSDRNPDKTLNTLFVSTDIDALRDSGYQENMSVIPYPKLNTSIENYHSWLSDNTLVYSVPANLPKKREDMVSAVLEVMASETRRLCLPAYYETALGDMYIRNDWSRTMLDIIHDGVTADFVSIYSSSLNHVGSIMRQQVGYDDPDLASNYSAIYYNLHNKLSTLIRTYDKNTLKKYEPKTTAETEKTDAAEEEKFIAVNQISQNWEVFGVKYRNSGIIIPRDLSESFAYMLNDDGGISVRSCPVENESGAFPTSVIQSRNKVSLDGLEIYFKTDEGFKYSNMGYSASFSFVWTTQAITQMPQYTDQIGTNGLREAVPSDEGAYALSVVFMGSKDTGDATSDLMNIILHDGTDTKPEDDQRIGYRWTSYVSTDLSKGVFIEVNEDDELGYVVSVNGIEYRSGIQGGIESPIDLTVLNDISSEGQICMGAGVTGADEFANFTWDTINGEPAGTYFD